MKDSRCLLTIDFENQIVTGYAAIWDEPLTGRRLSVTSLPMSSIASYLSNPVVLCNFDDRYVVARGLDVMPDQVGLLCVIQIFEEDAWFDVRTGKLTKIGLFGMISAYYEKSGEQIVEAMDLYGLSLLGVNE